MSESLFLEERRQAILEQLEQDGRATVKALSQMMQVSEVTIRQDLAALEARGLIERTYGGAVYIGGLNIPQELSFNVRYKQRQAQKQALSAAAAALVQDGYSIAVDSSTTTYSLAAHLKGFRRLTLVTNGLMMAQSFLEFDEQQIRVLVTGGRLRPDSISVVGRPENLPDVNLNIGFFSCHSISSAIGATDIDPDEVQIKQALLARCLHVVYLVDGGKWRPVAPYTITPPNAIAHIITTDDAPADQIEQFRAGGTQVDVVSVDA